MFPHSPQYLGKPLEVAIDVMFLSDGRSPLSHEDLRGMQVAEPTDDIAARFAEMFVGQRVHARHVNPPLAFVGY